MTRGSLSEYFAGVGMKLLSPSDTAGQSSSNQHEVGDAQRSKALKRVLGNTPRTLEEATPFPLLTSGWGRSRNSSAWTVSCPGMIHAKAKGIIQ